MRLALAAVALALLTAPTAQAGVVSLDGTVLKFTAAAGVEDNIRVTRDDANDVFVSANGAPISETVNGCTESGGIVTCDDLANTFSRILVTTLDLDDNVEFNELGSIVGEADLGAGTDIANIVDQIDRPFRLIARGGSGRDRLLGGSLNDSLDGGSENDFINGRGGPDDLIGGDGFDEAHFDDGRLERVEVTLDDIANDGSQGEQDNVRSSIEDIYGTEHNDKLVGSTSSNFIQGNGGNDEITGGGGFDVLYGDSDFLGASGNDTIFARDGIGERVNCGAGTDKVTSDDIDGVSECETNDASPDEVLDRDEDGVNKPGDCNDANPAIKPGAFDTPDNGVDENCDGADATDLDRDDDTFNRPQDCDDSRSTVFPGAPEVAGNGRDEDCNGVDAPLPVVGAGVSFNTVSSGSRTRFSRLILTNLQAGDTIRIACTPRRCGIRTQTLRASRAGRLSITSRVRRALPARSRLEIRVSRPGAITAVLQLTMRNRKAPTARKLCLQPGAARPAAC